MRGHLAVAIDVDADVDAAEIGRIEPDLETALAALAPRPRSRARGRSTAPAASVAAVTLSVPREGGGRGRGAAAGPRRLPARRRPTDRLARIVALASRGMCRGSIAVRDRRRSSPFAASAMASGVLLLVAAASCCARLALVVPAVVPAADGSVAVCRGVRIVARRAASGRLGRSLERAAVRNNRRGHGSGRGQRSIGRRRLRSAVSGCGAGWTAAVLRPPCLQPPELRPLCSRSASETVAVAAAAIGCGAGIGLACVGSAACGAVSGRAGGDRRRRDRQRCVADCRRPASAAGSIGRGDRRRESQRRPDRRRHDCTPGAAEAVGSVGSVAAGSRRSTKVLAADLRVALRGSLDFACGLLDRIAVGHRHWRRVGCWAPSVSDRPDCCPVAWSAAAAFARPRCCRRTSARRRGGAEGGLVLLRRSGALLRRRPCCCRPARAKLSLPAGWSDRAGSRRRALERHVGCCI